jgi:hypothetical protein
LGAFLAFDERRELFLLARDGPFVPRRLFALDEEARLFEEERLEDDDLDVVANCFPP